jgi:hypothetical protein
VQQHSQPAQQNTGGAKFGQFLGQAVNVAGQLASTVAGAQTMGMGPVAGNLISGITGGNQGGLSGDLSSALDNQAAQQEQLLLLQERIQNESAQFNTLTNISKTEHETKMSAIRNVRAG